MTLSRRDVLRCTVIAASFAGLDTAATLIDPKKSYADGLTGVEANTADYGATGDGATDDTAAIHAARDAAGVGGKVMVPPGTYLVSGLKASLADQAWILSSDAVFIMNTDAVSPILTINADGVSVTGGLFDGIHGVVHDPSQNGITVNAARVSISNVKVQNTAYYGIAAYNSDQITITRCTVTNSYVGGIWAQNGRAAPSEMHDVSITENLVDNSMGGPHSAGIGVRGNSPDQRVNRVGISHNTIRLPYNQAGETEAVTARCCTDFTIENNVVFGGFLAVTCPFPIRAVISNNVLRGFSYVAIEIPGPVDSVTISRNLIDPDGTSATAGIQASAGAVGNVKIVGNNIKNFVGNCYLVNFGSDSDSKDVTVSENLLTSVVRSGVFTAIYFNGDIERLTVSQNVVDGGSSAGAWGVQFMKSVSSVSIVGNHFANLAGGAVLLAADGPGYRLDYIKVAENSLVNCGMALKDSTSNGAVVGSNVSTVAHTDIVRPWQQEPRAL